MAKTDEAKSVQEFFYRSPEANSVQLVGDFTHWQGKPINLVKQTDGAWKTSVTLPAGTYDYRFLVDGAWCDDPECTLRIPNVFGSHNMVRKVSGNVEAAAQAKATLKPARSECLTPAGGRVGRDEGTGHAERGGYGGYGDTPTICKSCVTATLVDRLNPKPS